ncbi:MAG: FKBP-type peptidyl-prolyl cis-trans isomerase [Bacteroidales bacterium]|nr:FKBP-type peptidyl-prolyl cis-trans isomerase [Bacteroidales bacterium]NCU35326.1 peptidylprolyl isomerase [Candidatus Falkowbacteria bacterium]MDD3131897.1 FKBP-type peptidyl-prolyl cis-trans isomerase [Bacteroidales bacterium]MDD3527367.1 FKBP-type peptidyl-prolyl cis-trans isomerase [Bacteroidales bacterium]MDD4177703.1 FKBP-type peptidyl-prolyl cis-trans isomerase [Bacteroidales bacterium]
MMTIKRWLPLLMLLAATSLLLGCSKNDDTDEKQAQLDEEIIQDYLEQNNITAERHASGIYYKITVHGAGKHPEPNSLVEVFYKGYLTNGNIFDKTANASRVFPLSNLIEGWKIGIPLLQEGGSGTFFIPSALGYPNGTNNVPPHSVLIFDIDLVSVQ